ncbi:MAG TPA: TIGR00730 family Rossman fold protein [Rhodospirillales bacterium]
MKNITSLCVFCGSKNGTDPAHAAAARRLGQLMAEQAVRLVFGGGRIGLMGVLADAVIQGGGKVTGVIPEFLMDLEVEHRGVDEIVVTSSMHARKTRMFELADGFVVLAGGLGTLDETLEVITWKQLQIHAKPVVIVDTGGYWSALVDLIRRAIDGGFAHPKVMDLFTVVTAPDDVFPALAAQPAPDREVLTSHL